MGCLLFGHGLCLLLNLTVYSGMLGSGDHCGGASEIKPHTSEPHTTEPHASEPHTAGERFGALQSVCSKAKTWTWGCDLPVSPRHEDFSGLCQCEERLLLHKVNRAVQPCAPCRPSLC